MAFHLLECRDIAVAVPAAELEAMCAAGNVLRGLVFGQQGAVGAAHAPNLSLFAGFDHKLVNLLRLCVRGAELPPYCDRESVRDFADVFGGFACVDAALEAARRREAARAPTPISDHARVYEWRTFLAADVDACHMFADAQRQGYVHASSSDGVHHFRRARAEADARAADAR